MRSESQPASHKSSTSGPSSAPPPTVPGAAGPQTAQLDWLSDFVIPAAVFGLLGTLLYFLIDLRQYLVGGEAAILRYVVFWFLIGVIALARLSARPATSSTPPIVYATALAVVVAWVTIMLSQLEGPWASPGRYNSPGLAVLLNLGTVAGIWVAAWFLTGACTRPERALEELRSGGVTAAAGYRSAVATPLRAILVVTAVAVAVFGYGLGIVNPFSAIRAHAFVCAALFLLFALVLMALVTLGAARLAAHEGRLRVRRHVVGSWIGGAAVFAAAALIAALVLPEVASRMRPLPEGIAHRMITHDRTGRGLGAQRGDSSWVDRVPGGVRGMVERLVRGNRRQPGAPPQQGDSGSSIHPRPHPRPVTPRRPSWLWLLLLILAAAAAAWRFRRHIAAYFRALGRGILRMLSALMAFLARLFSRRLRQGEADLPRDPWADIFAIGPVDALDPNLAVRHVWRALQLYYAALGVGRREQETEMEFARRAPARFSIEPSDVRRVAMLYCASEYGAAPLGPEVVEQMRELWTRLLAASKVAREADRGQDVRAS